MDFVVVGLGLGALMMLAGFGLRDLGPWLFGSAAPERSLPEFEAIKTTIRKQTLASIGTAIATAGVGLAIVTFAALLARIDDDLGTIVVGMSLALAAVGVGAWTYDAIRRYRAAMDVVSGQEESVMARFTPAPTVRAEKAGRRTSTMPVEPNAAPLATVNTGETETTPPAPTADIAIDDAALVEANEVSEVAPEAEARSSIEEADDLDLSDPEFDFSAPWDDPADQSPMPHAETTPIVPFKAEPTPDERNEPGDTAPKTGPAIKPPQAEPSKAITSGRENAETARWPSRAPRSSERPAKRDEPEFTALPPLPGDQDDALIDESVRFDFPRPAGRNVPSWLFDDLETDLNRAGSPSPEDAIDQFRGSIPHQRGSALDRILAGDDPDKESDDDPDDSDGESNGA